MDKRRERIEQVSKSLAEEAHRLYTGKKDYKRAIEIYTILATYNCVPKKISEYSQFMMSSLSKKIKENS